MASLLSLGKAFINATANFSIQFNYTNVAVAILLIDKVYTAVPTWASSILSSMVFAGSILGMLVFGYLGDALGRTKALTLTFSVTIMSAIGSAFLSYGDEDHVFISISAWRFCLGMGIGGCYPLSAAESFENDESGGDKNARVAWTLFWQQPAQVVTYFMALIILSIAGSTHYDLQMRTMLALGAVPPALVLPSALLSLKAKTGSSMASVFSFGDLTASFSDSAYSSALFGTSACWLIFDIYVYGVSIYTPEIMEKLFGSSETLAQDYWQNVMSTAVTVPAALLNVYLIYFVKPRDLQIYGFVVAAASFAAMGLCWNLFSDNKAFLFCAFLLLKFATMFAVPATTFLLPNTIFHKNIRSSCNGVSAASGKIGAFIGTFGFPYLFDAFGMAGVFFSCAVIAGLGLFITRTNIPDGKLEQPIIQPVDDSSDDTPYKTTRDTDKLLA